MKLVPDSSVWVASFIPSEPCHFHADQFVLDAWEEPHQLVAPVIFLPEVVCGISKRYRHFDLDRVFVGDVEEDLAEAAFMTWKRVDLSLARDAAAIGMMYHLRGMDAIYAATAMYFGIPLLTEDDAFDNMKDVLGVLRLRDVVHL